MSGLRVFAAPNVDLDQIVGAVRAWLEASNYKTQVLPTDTAHARARR